MLRRLEEALEAKSRIDQEKYLTMVVMGTGIFEQLHMLMTFEDTLMNFFAGAGGNA